MGTFSLQDALVALRLISNQHQRVIHFRDIRPHILAENMSYEPNSAVTDIPRGTLKVCGFVRGKSLCVNRLVHLPGYGDFQMSQVITVCQIPVYCPFFSLPC